MKRSRCRLRTFITPYERDRAPSRQDPIFYGCGDFIDDYEGISGCGAFRDDLTLMYFLSLNPTDSSLTSFEMLPMQIRHLRLQRAVRTDARWLYEILRRKGGRLDTDLSSTWTTGSSWFDNEPESQQRSYGLQNDHMDRRLSSQA